MKFYITPPNGFTHLETLYDLATKRLLFLNLVNDLDLNNEENRETSLDHFHDRLISVSHLSEAVIEGTENDSISHFILKLAVIMKRTDREFVEFFIRRETKLFHYRLLTSGYVEESLKELSTERRRLDIANIAQRLSKFRRITGETRFEVPFEYALRLVASRRVLLSGGYAVITDETLIPFLVSIFETRIRSEIVGYVERVNEDDARISNLCSQLIDFFRHNLNNCRRQSISSVLKSRDVDEFSVFFPPCFKKLHHTLRETNRLQHHPRIAYTLYLKEIGMSSEENIRFWSSYYSKPGYGRCSHSWQKDEKRIRYSIKHAYGLEGSKRNYCAHGCVSIQRSVGPNEQLSCPFSQDIEDLPTGSTQRCRKDLQKILQKPVKDFSKPSEYFFTYCLYSKSLHDI